MITNQFLCGDVRQMLSDMSVGSVHMVATSPPYWGLRDYGLEPSVWGDGGTGCLGLEPTPELYVARLVEVFDAVARVLRPDGTLWLNLGDSYAGGGRAGKNLEYMERHTEFGGSGRGAGAYGLPMGVPDGLKAKDLVGIPWQVAFALRARGWYLRAAIPWVKRNCMPSSVTDRPTTAVEYVFLFAHPESKGRYFYDVEGCKIPSTGLPAGNKERRPADGHEGRLADHMGRNSCWDGRSQRQLRDTDFFFDSLRAVLDDAAQDLMHDEDGDPLMLTVNPGGGAKWDFCSACGAYFEGPDRKQIVIRDGRREVGKRCICGRDDAWEQHFAMWPERLVAPMIKAGTSEYGVCATCGTPWEREAGEKQEVEGRGSGNVERKLAGDAHNDRVNTHMGSSIPRVPTTASTVGWHPTCACLGNHPVPATVLDPFGGAGTTLSAACKLGRSGVYIDAKDAYSRIAKAKMRRITGAEPEPESVVETLPAAEPEPPAESADEAEPPPEPEPVRKRKAFHLPAAPVVR